MITPEEIATVLKIVDKSNSMELRAFEHLIFERRFDLEKSEENRVRNIKEQMGE